MNNVLTQQLRLATKQYVSGILLFTRPLLPIPDWTQVIFRGYQLLQAVPPIGLPNRQLPPQRPDKARIRNGDVIICVYSGPREHTLVGTVSTKDHYKRVYEIPIEVVVTDPQTIATAYLHEKDPAGQIIGQLKKKFEDNAYNYDHDQIPQFHWPFENWSKQLLPDAGLVVRQSGQPTFRMDFYYTNLSKLQKEEHEKQERLRYEYTLTKKQKEFEFRKNTMEKNFARQEEVKDQIHRIYADMLQVVSTEMKTTLQERVRDGFEKGYQTSQIWDEVFTVLYAIGGESQQITVEQRIAAYIDELQKKKEQPSTFEDEDEATSVNTEPEIDIIEIEDSL